MLHAGIDMHKKFSVATVVDDDGEEIVRGRRLENSEEEIRRFFDGFDEELTVVLEAGPSWQWMCDLLDELGLDNKLCHPLKTKAIASARIKTDKIDSKILAHLCRMDFIPEAHKADRETRHLRELLRFRASMVRMRASVKNRVHSLLAKLNVKHSYSDLFGKEGTRFLRELTLPSVYREALDGYMKIIGALSAEVKKAEKRVSGEYKGSPEAQLLSTIPGVGPLLALTIASEIDDIDRFHSAKHLSSFAGLVPSTSQSGGNTHHGKITRQGSAWLRWALAEAIIHAVRYPGPLRDFYIKLEKRKGKKVARVAAARKLSTYVYHMLKEKKDYQAVTRYLKSDLG